MPFIVSAAAICLIVCHGGPADHFATFAQGLSNVEIFACGSALKKFQERGVDVKHPFVISEENEDRLAEEIAKACSVASVVITDVGHRFDIKVQKALAKHHVFRIAYYDNPEPYVPGGYSAVAAEVMLASQRVLFANFNLVDSPIFQDRNKEIDFGDRRKIGIGYYPLYKAEKIAERRKTEHVSMHNQKVLVYFGGNNEEYFTKAFPAFLKFLEQDLPRNLVFIIQQHPDAKEKNLDGNLLSSWLSKQSKAPKIILSDFTSDDVQIMADGVLYYQTSMSPQFVLAGIPTAQVGHETYYDVLVKNQLCPSVTDAAQFRKTINDLIYQKSEPSRAVILEGLGYKANWLENLKQAINP